MKNHSSNHRKPQPVYASAFLNNSDTDSPNPCAICSNDRNDGDFNPRSICEI